MRIAFFLAVVKGNIDGVSHWLLKLLDFLNKNGVESAVFSTSSHPDQHNVMFFKVDSLPLPFYQEYRVGLPSWRAVDKPLKKFKPDIIHILSPCTVGHYGSVYAKKHKIPLVATYHTHFASYAKYYKVDFLLKISWAYLRGLYKNCVNIYVPSKPVLDEVKKQGLKNLIHLPHGVDTDIFNPKYKSSGWRKAVSGENKVILLYVGRLVWEKNLQVLATAYRLLSRKRKDFVMVIVGDGPIKDELKMLMPRAKFLGAKYGKDLSTAYASADIFVFPSVTETFGLVTLEAMASGIVPVVADAGGSKSIVTPEKTGLLAKPGDAVDFTRKTYQLIDNSKKRKELSANALKFAKKQDWNIIFKKQLEFYKRISGKHKTRKKQSK